MKRLLLVLLCSAPLLAQQARGVPVVLISVDGLKPDYILDADRHGLKVPHLRRMMADGAYAKAVTGVLPTVTYPAHTTMVTGVSPAKHGILYNSPFDPFGKNQDGWMWYAEDIKAPTLWEAINRAGFTSSTVDWPVTVGGPATWNIVQYWRATTEDDHKLLRALSTPGLLDEGEKAVGRYPAGYIYTVDTDRRRAAFAAWLITARKPRFHTSYFSVLDEVQHAQGPYTAEVFSTIEAIDGMVATIAQAAAAADPRSVVCVVSDHGFARYDKTVSINVALKNAGLIDVNPDGTLKDWRAITYGPAVVVKDRADTATVRAAADVLAKLAADPGTGVFRIMDAAAVRAGGGFPDAAFVVGVRAGYSISGRLTGEIVRPSKPGGTHGLLRELPEMDSAFFIAGTGVPKGRVFERIDMLDIAPTLAAVAGVALPTAEGRDLFAQR
jgi:predicted AlkP superfamily pyrophosphatase or phosphodiesterase